MSETDDIKSAAVIPSENNYRIEYLEINSSLNNY